MAEIEESKVRGGSNKKRFGGETDEDDDLLDFEDGSGSDDDRVEQAKQELIKQIESHCLENSVRKFIPTDVMAIF